jgi:RimJ/RimL family protein N-acetyltransferase
MPVSARVCKLDEIAPLRESYREEMDCQIIHDSIHARPGWTIEYALDVAGACIGYGSVAVAGPWSTTHALYEFFVCRAHRHRIFDAFAALVSASTPAMIETQSNAPMLCVMLHTFASNVSAEAILLEDRFETRLAPEGARFRATEAEDEERLRTLNLDDGAGWVVTWNGEIAGAGGVLYHYNRPYGDVYMKIAEPFRGKGLGAYLVQELKAACRAGESVPAARCNVANLASRRTLQKAGFVPCGNLVTGILGQSSNA